MPLNVRKHLMAFFISISKIILYVGQNQLQIY